MKRIVRAQKRFQKYIGTSFDERDLKRNDQVEPYNILSDQEIELEVEEVRILLPFGGTLAAKWWGDKSVRPIVCIHGLQDNAGTFDRLIPLLPKKHSYLAIDLPGHGLSSWIPNGMAYHLVDYIPVLDHLLSEYNWDKISLLGHSLGSILCFLFASIFPNKVDMVIGLDALKPHIYNKRLLKTLTEQTFHDFIVADKRNQEKSEPPAYSIEEMAERLCNATYGSVTLECAPYLLKRNVKNSEKYPGKFYFARDSRLKYLNIALFPQFINVQLAKKIDMPYLFIKAKNNTYYEKKEYHDEIVNVMKQNRFFEYHIVDSTHHLHLTDPEKVAAVVYPFIEKHRSLANKL